MKARQSMTIIAILAIMLVLLAGCATPTPEVVEKEVVVTQIVEETVYVEGTPKVVEVTKIVKETVEVEKPAAVEPESKATEGSSGQIIIAQVGDPEVIDPNYIKTREAQNVLRLIYDSLYHRDDDMQIIPWLATSYENPDELTWRFHLREGVKFHNGNDFTASDVKFSIYRLMEDDSTSNARDFIDRVEVIDDFTVDIITKEPYAAFLTRVVLMHMTDEETFAAVGVDGFTNNPIGTGPFKFVEWVKDERVVFEANPNYWGGAPNVQTVIFVPIPESATRIAALEAGDVDIIASVPPEYVDQAPEGVDVLIIPGTRAFYLGLNVNMEPFDNKLVRQAMNYAVDVDSIIENVLNGLARRIDNPVLPEAFGYAATPVYNFNPEKARSLMAEAGYPDGFEMELDSYPDLKEIAEALAGQLAAVGITAKVNILEKATCYAKYQPGFSQSFLTSWGNSEADADGILMKQLYSKRFGCDLTNTEGETGYGDTDLNCYYTGYGNADVDAYLEAGARISNQDERRANYYHALNIIVEEAPWVFLYNPSEVFAKRSRVQGWAPRSDALFNLDNAWATE
ncbi:MAG: hypothetical protein JXA42_24495 [Anaerolineales bacterium]|nr:hypothetical protein [Anaerolineales bacterium]